MTVNAGVSNTLVVTVVGGGDDDILLSLLFDDDDAVFLSLSPPDASTRPRIIAKIVPNIPNMATIAKFRRR